MESQRSTFSRSSEGPRYSRTSSSYEISRSNELSARTNFPLERYTSIVYFASSSCLRTRFPCSTEVADEVSWFLVVASTILRCYDDSYAYKTESVLEESARSSYETRIRPLTHVSVDRAYQAESVGSNSLVSILIAIRRSPNL